MTLKDTGTYRLHLVELKECRFTKAEAFYQAEALDTRKETVPDADLATTDRDSELDFTTYFNRHDQFLWVGVKASVRIVEKQQELLSVFVEMRGLFEIVDEPAMKPEAFGEVNGPAILFPFVREQVASLTLKANIPPILLPPINFVKRAQEGKTPNAALNP